MITYRLLFVFIAFVIVAVICGCGGGGGGGGSQSPSALSSVTVTGTVSDAVSDKPVAGASIAFEPTGRSSAKRVPQSALTDTEGYYECKDVPIGEIKITVILPDGTYQAVENVVSIPGGSKSWKWSTRLIPRDIPAATSITISPRDQSVQVGAVLAFTATVSPDPRIKPTFTVSGGVGTISDDGLFVASKAGQGTVYARVGAAMDSTTVTVTGVATLGSLTGEVTDSAGRPIAGAYVSAGSGINATTGVDGRYVLADLSPGSYTLSFSRNGFKPTSQAGVSVAAGSTAVVDVSLSAGVLVTINGPDPIDLSAGESHTFTATVTGATDTRVTWSITGGGTITSDGKFTAPSVRGTTKVTATSRQDATAKASVTANVQSGSATVIIN